ncbi:hypothetical protein BB560_005745 [Smittium megazygosporum]|uniref:U3 small nucleolar RNA-associated protein 6 N-terminal domain-containing protein n=1 Tax=Smittium megazygosporum TaxID=133381 RepID=A0A2T9YYI5_9FUNG|nr:hypothetical protein BB560_005745 [Smittium megazygosporum]
MAETVQYRLEGMIPELEDFERKGIFSRYLIKRRQPKIQDFLRYIEYELNLDLLRKKRKTRSKISRKFTVSDRVIKERIIGLFEKAIEKHRGVKELWNQYISFVRDLEEKEQDRQRNTQIGQLGQYARVMKLYARAIQNFPNEPDFWVKAALFEFEINNNDGNARRLMQRGIRLNNKNTEMWLEYCKLELSFAEKIKLRRKILLGEDTSDAESSEINSESFIQVPVLDDEEQSKQDSKNSEMQEELTKIAELQDLEYKQILDDDNKKILKKSKVSKKSVSARVSSFDNENNPFLQGKVAALIYKYAIDAIPFDFEFRKSFLLLFYQFHYPEIVESIANDILACFETAEKFNPEAVFYAKTAVFSLYCKQNTSEWLEKFVSIDSSIYSYISTLEEEIGSNNSVNSKDSALLNAKRVENLENFINFYLNWIIEAHNKAQLGPVKAYLKELAVQRYNELISLKYKSPTLVISMVRFFYTDLNDTEHALETVSNGIKLDFVANKQSNKEIDLLVCELHWLYLTILANTIKKELDENKQSFIQKLDSLFGKSLDLFKSKNVNNLQLIMLWLDLSTLLYDHQIISEEEIQKRYKTAFLNLTLHFNKTGGKINTSGIPNFEYVISGLEEIKFVDPEIISFIRVEPETRQEALFSKDLAACIQIKYILWRMSLHKRLEKTPELLAKLAFQTIKQNTKLALKTINFVVDLQMSLFESLLSENNITSCNKIVFSSYPKIQQISDWICETFEVAVSEYPKDIDNLEKYAEFLTRIGNQSHSTNIKLRINQLGE